MRALLYQALIWLNRKFKAELLQNQTNRHICNIIDLVSVKFKREHNVSFYANELNISPGHLNDLSKSVLGISAKKYISESVLTEAKKFLALSDLPVSEIASELGYIDTSYFIRRFKNETGMTAYSEKNKTFEKCHSFIVL